MSRTFDEICEAQAEIAHDDPDGMMRFTDEILTARDLPEREREAFMTGYVTGMSTTLALLNADRLDDAAERLLNVMQRAEGFEPVE